MLTAWPDSKILDQVMNYEISLMTAIHVAALE
jgi:hypothetical protein